MFYKSSKGLFILYTLSIDMGIYFDGSTAVMTRNNTLFRSGVEI